MVSHLETSKERLAAGTVVGRAALSRNKDHPSGTGGPFLWVNEQGSRGRSMQKCPMLTASGHACSSEGQGSAGIILCGLELRRRRIDRQDKGAAGWRRLSKREQDETFFFEVRTSVCDLLHLFEHVCSMWCVHRIGSTCRRVAKTARNAQ